MGEVMFGMAIFFGLWLAWTVGYYINDWVRKLFSYRVRVTDTHVEFTPATPVEIEQRYDQKVKEVDHYVNPLTCYVCGLQDIDGVHLHPTIEDVNALDETGDLEATLSAMSPDQRDAFYFSMKLALEDMVEEPEEIVTFADNLKFVAPRSNTPPYTHLDL